MFPKLKISSFVMKRIEGVKQQCSGCLFGLMYDGTLLVLGFNVESTIGQLNYKQIQHKFPAEVDLCGLIKFAECSDAEAHISEILQDVDITDNPILLQCELGTLVGLKASLFMHGKLQEIPYEIMSEEELYRDFCFTRLRYCVNFMTVDNNVESIKKDIQSLRKELASGSLAFHIANTDLFLTGSSNEVASFPISTKILEVLKMLEKASLDDSNKSKKQQKHLQQPTDYEIININVLRGQTIDLKGEPGPAISISVNHDIPKVRIPIDIDAMAMLYKSTRLMSLYDILIESICRSLRLTEQSLIDNIESGNQLAVPATFHFAVPEFGHFLSCVYLDNNSEDESHIQQSRKKLHHHFSLPVQRPYFRKANRYIFKEELAGEPLVCPHLGVKPSGIIDGKQYLIQGKYSYYHYMQKNFDDNGWGCAYRSLQTLCSWFRWQGYTEKPIPTHKEIQELLVQSGDKERSFIGSRQWIGSTEVFSCLHDLLNVTSRIMHVSSGGELSTKGSELAIHFQTQGTPIMIGGGVLAHTILGVDYNNNTGDIKFLILDPHYTGTEDLITIQNKGWCGWKSPEFWDKKSYYNLCMPQRPIMY